MQSINFKYRNHRGEVAERHIIPDALEFIAVPDPLYYNQPGWFLSGFDLDKQARRSFSLASIVYEPNGGTVHGNYMKLRFQE